MRQCDMKWRTGSYYHKGNSKLCPCPTKDFLSDKDQLARPPGRGESAPKSRILEEKKVQTKNLMCMEKTTGIRTGRKPQKDPVDKSTVSD